MKSIYKEVRTVFMSGSKNRNTEEIQSEIFANKKRIQHLIEKLQVLKEIVGEKP